MGFKKILGPLDRLGLLRWHPCANRKSTIFDASRAGATGKACEVPGSRLHEGSTGKGL